MCLSAACGFRIFAPFLVLSAAAMGGFYTPADELSWIGSWTAVALFGTATAVEVLAYYIPWADNLLDTIATPAAMVAGVVASASVLGELPPALQWTLAAVAGGGAAGLVQAATVLLRGASSTTTGGLGNSVISTTELVFAVSVAVLALLAPFVALALLVIAARFVWKYTLRRRPSTGQPQDSASR
ncbi:MAG: DUF4126 domain-containing protein [Gemmatimonadales bacterium]